MFHVCHNTGVALKPEPRRGWLHGERGSNDNDVGFRLCQLYLDVQKVLTQRNLQHEHCYRAELDTVSNLFGS